MMNINQHILDYYKWLLSIASDEFMDTVESCRYALVFKNEPWALELLNDEQKQKTNTKKH